MAIADVSLSSRARVGASFRITIAMTPAATTPADEPARSIAATVDETLARALAAGDEGAWRRFLDEQHGVFVRAVQTAAWKQGQRVVAGALPALVDEAKTYFYTAFTRSFRAYQGEGRFFAFLFATIGNFLREQTRASRRTFQSLDERDDGDDDGGEPDASARQAVLQWQAESAGPDPGLLARMHRCLLRLPEIYRTVVTMHFFQEEARPLRSLAAALGATVENVHKRFQRGLQQLRACMELQGEIEHG